MKDKFTECGTIQFGMLESPPSPDYDPSSYPGSGVWLWCDPAASQTRMSVVADDGKSATMVVTGWPVPSDYKFWRDDKALRPVPDAERELAAQSPKLIAGGLVQHVPPCGHVSEATLLEALRVAVSPFAGRRQGGGAV